MTVTEKLAHAAERKAFETMLDSLIRKSRTQDVGKVADDLVSMVQKIHSSVWEPETFAMLHKIANDPNSKWAHYAERLLRECDPYLLRTFLTAAAYEGGFRGKATTPYLLAKIKDLTGGDSLDSNIQLVFNNARLGAAAAVELAKLER